MSDFNQRQIASNQRRIGQTEVKEVPFSDISARVYNSANISIANNTSTKLTFDSERWDTDGMHSTSSNTGRLTCTHAGKHLIVANVFWATAAGGRRALEIDLNGATPIAVQEIGSAPDGTGILRMNLTTIYDLAVGDYVEVSVFQTSGGALNITAAGNYSPEFMIQRLP